MLVAAVCSCLTLPGATPGATGLVRGLGGSRGPGLAGWWWRGSDRRESANTLILQQFQRNGVLHENSQRPRKKKFKFEVTGFKKLLCTR